MVAPVKVCGTFITKKVPIALAAGSVLSFIAATACFWVQAVADCFDDEEWFDWSCSTYKTHLITYGFTCLAAGAGLLGTAGYMVYKLQRARGFTHIPSDPDLTVVQGGYCGFQQTNSYQTQQQMVFPQRETTAYFSPEQEAFASQKPSYYS